MDRPPAVSFLGLPVELQLCVFDYLDYPSRFFVSQTNRHLRSVVEVERPTTMVLKIRMMHIMENWPR